MGEGRSIFGSLPDYTVPVRGPSGAEESVQLLLDSLYESLTQLPLEEYRITGLNHLSNEPFRRAIRPVDRQ